MRNVIALAGAALAVSACGSKTADGNVAADSGMSAQAITANDVTAIDAVTGDAANMAADVDYSNLATAENTAGGTKPQPQGNKPRPGRPAEGQPTPEPANEPQAEPAPANTTE